MLIQVSRSQSVASFQFVSFGLWSWFVGCEFVDCWLWVVSAQVASLQVGGFVLCECVGCEFVCFDVDEFVGCDFAVNPFFGEISRTVEKCW